ncbi:hypothetical protein CEXT_154631 [Caerostris extrusa]|uniref:Uncharacterized protein n=1 Tax=Caerostris extrusa TaxID=172846 RepID=A0AAV4M7Q4_CAEEX|nr:hypothetical protein CEXT_154631 [Caerostris extrusa]
MITVFVRTPLFTRSSCREPIRKCPSVIGPDRGSEHVNNKIQSLEEARLPNRTRFLFLDHNLIASVFLLESLEF